MTYSGCSPFMTPGDSATCLLFANLAPFTAVHLLSGSQRSSSWHSRPDPVALLAQQSCSGDVLVPGFPPSELAASELLCSLEPPVTCGRDFRKAHAEREGLAVPAESRPRPPSAKATTGCLQDQQKTQLSPGETVVGFSHWVWGGLLYSSEELKH